MIREIRRRGTRSRERRRLNGKLGLHKEEYMNDTWQRNQEKGNGGDEKTKETIWKKIGLSKE